jgi:hypothetical protein
MGSWPADDVASQLLSAENPEGVMNRIYRFYS